MQRKEMVTKNLEVAKILDVFNSMEYPNTEVDVSAAEKWLFARYGNENPEMTPYKFDEEKPFIYYPCLNKSQEEAYRDIKNNTKWLKFSASVKTNILYKFAAEIDRNSELICQFELLLHNILPRDTNKYGIPIIKDYLQYYANFTEDGPSNADGANVVLCPLNELFSLAEIGFFLGSLLAQGYNIIFGFEINSSPKMNIFMDFLVELAVKAGIPEGTISTIVTFSELSNNLFEFVIHKNMYDDKINFDNRKLFLPPYLRTSIIVFNDADLDSACESTVAAIWSYCGRLPWAVDTVFVQEDVFTTFVGKLKDRIKKLKFSKNAMKSDNISFDNFETLGYQGIFIDKLIENAKEQGIETYKSNCAEVISPTLFIGGKVNGNNVMSEEINHVRFGTVIPFRTPKEAAALANNSKQGLAVSLWSQNSSLINEAIRKLDVGTIWVNCHGIIKASVGFTTRKNEGVGYIGGVEGLYEFKEMSISSRMDIVETKNTGLLTSAKKAQEAWNKLSLNNRMEKLSKLVQTANDSKWSKVFYKATRELSRVNTTQTIDNFDLRVYRDPVGVVIVNKTDDTIPVIIISALILGNSVLVVEQEQTKKEIDELSKNLPPGVLGNITPIELATAFEVLKQSLVVVGNETPVNRCLDCQKHYDISEKNEILKFVVRRCTINKNVWSDIGESF